MGIRADIDALPYAPRMVNLKPSRLGGVQRLFHAYDVCAERGMLVSFNFMIFDPDCTVDDVEITLDFADECVGLLADVAQCERIGQAALTRATGLYGREAFVGRVEAALRAAAAHTAPALGMPATSSPGWTTRSSSGRRRSGRTMARSAATCSSEMPGAG